MKYAAFLLMLLTTPALAGTITFQVVEAGQTTATKVYTVSDADIDRLVAAYQSAANTSINGTATRAQVLLYLSQQWIQAATQYVVSTEHNAAVAAVVTPPVVAN